MWHNAKVKTFCLNYTFIDFLIVQTSGPKNCRIFNTSLGKHKTNTEETELQIFISFSCQSLNFQIPSPLINFPEMSREACNLHLNIAAQGCGEPLAVDSEIGVKV